jgi:hypothetical protein
VKAKTKAVGAALELAGKKTTTEASAALELDGEKTPTLPFYPLELDGKTYKLCFVLRELAKAEQELRREGHRANMLLALNVGSLDLDAVETLFAATVRTFHPELRKYDDAVALVTLSSVYQIATVILEALVAENRGGAGKPIEGVASGEVKGETSQQQTAATVAH